MKKIVAEDSDRRPFYIARDDNAPEEHKYIITGALLDPTTSIKAPSIPACMQALRNYMLNHGRVLITYELTPSETPYNSGKGSNTNDRRTAGTGKR